MKLITRKLGRNRGKSRLWIEGASLEGQGWITGSRFDIAFKDGSIVLTRADDGKRKVAGAPGRPILDTNSDKITDALGIERGQLAEVKITGKRIVITPASK